MQAEGQACQTPNMPSNPIIQKVSIVLGEPKRECYLRDLPMFFALVEQDRDLFFGNRVSKALN